MALQYSPKISTEGLVLCLDPGNNKSFPSYTLPVKAGLTLWLDAADETTFTYGTGGVYTESVQQWRDKSGNNFHANQSLVSAQPARSTFNNGKPSVYFASSAVNYLLISANPNLALPGDVSIFIVYRPYNQTTNYAVLLDNYHGTGGTYGFVIQRVNNLNQFYYGNGNGSTFVDTSSSPWTYTESNVELLSLNKSSSVATPYTTGTAQTARTVHATTSQYTTGLVLGGWGSGGRSYNGDMCEILIFNRSLTLKEMKQVHTYLGVKWGVSNTDRSIQDLVFNSDSKLGEGTVANMPRFDYYNGGALAFDGVNDYFYLNEGSAVPYFNPDGSTVTVNLWFKAATTNTGGTNKMIFSDNCSPEFSLHQVDNTVYAYSYAGVSATIQANKWYNACWTSNAGAPSSATTTTVTFYLDGSLVGTSSTSTGNGLNDTPLTLGKDPCAAGTNWSGSLGPVNLYNKVLTAKEVKQNYDALKTRFFQTIVQGGLIAHFDLGNPFSYSVGNFMWYDVNGNNYVVSFINFSGDPILNGNSITFDGTDDFVEMGYPDITPVAVAGNGARSIYVWMRTTFTGNMAFVSTGTPANSQAFNLVKYGSYVGVMGYNNDYYPGSGNSGITITDGRWHYIGVSFDGTNLRTYVDGILDNTSGTITYSTTGQNNAIAKSNHSGNENYFNGALSVVQFYNRALSGAEVLQNYNATKGRYGR